MYSLMMEKAGPHKESATGTQNKRFVLALRAAWLAENPAHRASKFWAREDKA